MPIQLTGVVGPQGPLVDSTQSAPARQGKYGELSVSELQAKYYEQAYRGNIFFAAHQAATTFSANGMTSASAVGLCVYNPPQSNKNLVPIQLELVMTNYVTTSTDVQVVVALSSAYSNAVPVSAGGLTAYCSKGVGQAVSIALCAATLTFAAAPIIWKAIYSAFNTTTIASAIPTASAQVVDIGGSLVIPPGTGMAIVASNASTGIASVTWMELAI
jgi:hypothetical protein